MQRFSANLGFLWPGLPLLDQIDAAWRAGFKAVELHFPYATPAEVVKEACAKRGLTLLGINTNIGAGADGHRGLAAVPGREAEFRALADQALDWASTAGGTAVHVMAGVVPEKDRAAGADVMVRNLREIAPKAADRNLVIFLEALNTRDNPGYFYSEIERAVDIADRVGAPNVKVMFDAYHVGVAQGDVIPRLKKLYGTVGHVQIAGVPDRGEPDESTFAYPELFSALDDLGYSGWIGCEYKPRGDTDAGLKRWTKALNVTL